MCTGEAEAILATANAKAKAIEIVGQAIARKVRSLFNYAFVMFTVLE